MNNQWVWSSGVGGGEVGKVPGEIVVGLVYHIGGVYGSQWKPLEITKVVAFIGLEAYKSSNRYCKNLNSTEVCMMET